MIRIQSFLIACVSLAGWLSLGGCVKEEDISANKKQENDQQIRQYLAANSLNAQQTASGLYYQITQPNPAGSLTQDYDSVYVYYTVSRISDGFKFDSIPRTSGPFVFRYHSDHSKIPVPLLSGFVEGIGLMREGEKATLLLPSDLAFGSLSDPNYFPSYTPLRIDMELVKIENEERKINRYLAAKGWTDIIKRTSGLRFQQLTFVPDSIRADSGKTAYVRYTGKLLNDTQFDSNITNTAPLTVMVGGGSVVKGFAEGIALLRKGEKARLIFPSSLGYGTTGQRNSAGTQYIIPPLTPLVFEVEVVDVK